MSDVLGRCNSGGGARIRTRILYVIGQLARGGGAEQQLYYLLKYLRPDASVVSLSSGGYWAAPIRELGHKVIELERRGSFEWARLVSVVRLIKAINPDIVHVFTDSVSGMYGRLGALLARHPAVIVGERRHPEIDPRWYAVLKRVWLNRYATIVVSNAKASRDYLISKQGLPLSKVRVIPNALEVAGFGAAFRVSPKSVLPAEWRDRIIVGMVCRLHPKKDPLTFVRVAHSIVESEPDVRFVHAGDGELRRDMERLSRELGIADKIWFMGLRSDVPAVLGALDIFILTSRNEGAPNAVMEAMASGLPCVVSDAGGCREVVEHEVTGYVVRAGAAAEFTACLQHLIDNPQLRAVMGERGRRAAARFDVHAMAARYGQLYKEVLGTK